MTSLPFFPALREGELLYSALARHCHWAGSGSPKANAAMLFGSRSSIVSLDFPNRLSELAARMPGGYTPDYLIERHTLAPYYLAFAPTHIGRVVREGMKHDGRDLHLVSGVAAFRLGRVTRLRFCPQCLREMCATWGSAHWRRDHQLPSVLLCPDHGIVLRDSMIDLAVSNRHRYSAANSDTCPEASSHVTGPINAADQQTLLRLARASAALLDGGNCPDSLDDLTRFYRGELRNKGLMRSRKQADQARLGREFADRFGPILLRFPALACDGRLRGDWLAALTRRQRKICHPMEHLMLRDLLLARNREAMPWGEAPWSCRNPLAEHRGQHVVTNLRTYRNKGTLVAVFTCGCGYRFTRTLSTGGILGAPRFRDYGPLLHDELTKLIAQRLSLRAVARRLEIDPKTVVALAVRHRIEMPWTSGRRKAAVVKDKPATDSSPQPRLRRATSLPRRDWQQIDVTLAEKLRRAASSLRQVTPPVRVTTASLEREAIAKRGWIAKRRHKLGESVETISNAVETLSAFRTRRINYWVAEARSRGHEPKPWEVLRRAGVNQDIISVVAESRAEHGQPDETT